MELLMSNPICLAALSLDGQSVLIAISILFGSLALYITIKKATLKRTDKVRALEKTSMNRLIGIMSALFFTTVVMSWTTRESNNNSFDKKPIENEWVSNEKVEIVQIKMEIPKADIKPPKIESPKFEFKTEPETEEKKSEAKTGTSDGDPDSKKEKNNESKGEDSIVTVLPPVRIQEEEPITFAEKMPKICGCEEAGQTENERRKCSDKKMIEFLAKSIVYPQMAREMGYEGKVFVRFIVEKDGSLSNISVVKDATPGGGLAHAAIKAVNKMASEGCWNPAVQGGRKVKVSLVVPVNFSIEKN